MNPTNVLIVGGTGYLGKNFRLTCNEYKITHSVMDLRKISEIKIKDFDVVVDFSMIRRGELPWKKELIEEYRVNHSKLISIIRSQKQRYIRISSIFDVRNFIRNDSYTTLSQTISKLILNEISAQAYVIYSHTVYGGKNSTSFIDSGVLTNRYHQKSIRDYVHIVDLNIQILDLINAKNLGVNQFEVGTAVPYLSTDIKKYVHENFSCNLDSISTSSKVFRELTESNLVCSAIQPSIPEIKKILVYDKLSSYILNNN